MAEKPTQNEKNNRLIPLRQAGITVSEKSERPSKMLFDEVLRQEEITTQATPLTPPTITTQATPLTPPATDNKKSIRVGETAPVKDYQKVANSIVRETVPTGIFIGKSKLLYDCLYLLTRGAINPSRSIRIPKRSLMTKAGIGSERTLLKNLLHLKTFGLIKITEFEGQHGGNDYEVFLPEELETLPTPRTPPTAHHPPQKVGTLPPVESGVSDVGLSGDRSAVYENPKTLFKDFKYIDDDSPIYEAILMLNEAAKNVTRKNLTKSDQKALCDIFRIIIDETDLAVARTKSVTSYVSLGAENLRRRLYPKIKKQTTKNKESSQNWQSIGKESNFISLEEELFVAREIMEPLTEEARENALIIIRGILRDSTLDEIQSLAVNYTEEDWNWLLENLNHSKTL